MQRAKGIPQGNTCYCWCSSALCWFKVPRQVFAVAFGYKGLVDHAMVERRIKDRLLVVRSSFYLIFVKFSVP